MIRKVNSFSMVIFTLIGMIQMLEVKADDDIFVVDDYEPELVPPDETINITVGYVVLEFGINWNITCICDKPITWTYFDASFKWEPDVTITNTVLTNVYRPYRSVLQITNTSAASVGRYYCVNSEAWPEQQKVLLDALVTENSAVTIYVYVKDPNQPLIPLKGGLTFIVYPHETVTFPCKPSLPGIFPNLCTDDKSCFNMTDSTKEYILHYQMFNSRNSSLFCNFNNNTVSNMILIVATGSRLLVPSISGLEEDTAILGQPIKISCCFVYQGLVPEIRWKVPPHSRLVIKKFQDERVQLSNLDKKKRSESSDEYIATQVLSIERASYMDNGNYRCEVLKDDIFLYAIYNLYVRQMGKDYVKLKEKNKLIIPSWEQNSIRALNSIEISVQYRSYPRNISYSWFRNGKKIIINELHSKYVLKKTEYILKLSINEPTVEDTAVYRVTVKAGDAIEKCYTSVFVYAMPTAQLTSIEAEPNETVGYVCSSTGFPMPEIQLWFKPCNDTPWTNCSIEETPTTGWNETEKEWKDTLISTDRSYIRIANQPGVVYCAAQNSEGNVIARADLLVSDLIRERVDLKRIHPQTIVTVGDDVTISCLSVVYFYTNETFFEYKDKELNKSDRIWASDITYIGNPSYVWEMSFTIKNAKLEDAGNISCFVTNRNGTIERKDFNLTIDIPSKATIDNYMDFESRSVDLNTTLVLECVIGGVPEPQVRWFKIISSNREELIPEKNKMNITLMKQKNKSILQIESTQQNNTGTYRCEAINKVQRVSKSWMVDIRPTWLKDVMIFSIVSLLLLLIAVIVVFIHFYYKKKKEVEVMKEAGLAYFEEGNLDCYNPKLPLNEQVDLLPYNADYEFPIESLVLQSQLGSGAFGVVMKAKAIGIKEHENETTVAVKMIKKLSENEAMLALVTELKIMIHLGQHVNVVNLLGAVTKNISQRKLMVIIDFCPLGSVQDFLLKCRPHFIDQIVPETGEINRLRRSESGNLYNSHGVKYVKVYFGTNNIVATRDDVQLRTTSVQEGESSQEPQDYLNNRSDAGNVEHTSDLQRMPMDGPKNTKASVLSLKRSNNILDPNAEMKNEKPERTVNTTDLLCWAAQVASGMEYLASRNVLHGDLAARNVLLCHDNVVKICDFGLARSLYKRDKYKKKKEALLPFKWLALECIGDRVFSTFSDVWAYGVFLWELFSLAKAPYPGMDANEELYNKLLEGYRLEKPRYANQDIYDIMLPCWNETPDSRPSFQELKNQFNSMLPDGIREHLSKLNDPYVALNAEKIEGGIKDYLANIGASDKVASFVPDYVNVPASNDTPDENNFNMLCRVNRTSESSNRVIGEIIELPTRCEMIRQKCVQLSSFRASRKRRMSHNPEPLELDDSDDDYNDDSSTTMPCSIDALSNPCYITLTKADGSLAWC